MEQPIFSLNYTSCRPDQILAVVKLWRERADHPDTVEVVISVDGPNAAALAAAKAVPNASVICQNQPPFNCVRGWNAGAEATTGKVIINVADDFNPPLHWDTLLLQIKPENWIDGEYVVHVASGYVEDIMVLSIATRKRYERFGYMLYPGYESMFCLHPDTAIYMADFSFKPISSIRPGDEVVGVSKRIGKPGTGAQSRETLVKSKVFEVHSKEDALFEVKMSSGQTLRCTADHLWAYYADDKLTNYGVPKLGRKLVNILKVPPLPPPYDRDRGWLSGLFDGEGCFPVIVQSPKVNPAICSEIERVLNKFNFNHTVSDQVQRGNKQRVFTLTGGRDEYIRFINWLDPVKRNSKQVMKRLLSSRFGRPDEIVGIVPAGRGRVMCLSTSTRNYVADGYLSHNSDTEFTQVAYRDGVVLNAKHILFEHMHCDCGKRAKDEHDVIHGGKDRWVRGEMLFNYRKGVNFPIDAGPMAGKQKNVDNSRGVEPYAVYIQATDDDFCLFEVCERLISEGAKDFFICIPDEYWSGKPTPQENIDKIRAVMAKVEKAGGKVNIRVFDVSNYRFSGDSRIAVETRVRNDTLSWIRRSGFKHILIVDGDELWTYGLLDKVKDAVATSQPTCISVPMIPVVGLPGYPVHMASDRAVVYIDGSTMFRECRSPATDHYMLGNGIVIHFTACRKTMQDIIDKHRASGHYDDPDYDFEGWIKNVLPNLKPGWKGAHMYRRYQIWPLVRNWTVDEMAQIPASLRQYLGQPVTTPSPINTMLERTRSKQAQAAPKLHPFRLTQSEQFQGFSNNPFRV